MYSVMMVSMSQRKGFSIDISGGAARNTHTVLRACRKGPLGWYKRPHAPLRGGASLTAPLPNPKWPQFAKDRQTLIPPLPQGIVSWGGRNGAVAQLGERRNRTAEVRGSNPLGSTI